MSATPRAGRQAARRFVLLAGLLALSCAASAQSLTTLPATAPPRDPALASRSMMFDQARAADARARMQPQYVESITVEASDPDAPRVKRRAFEQRFVDALLGPPPESQIGMKRLDNRPCMSLPSTWNSLGTSFAPLAGCP